MNWSGSPVGHKLLICAFFLWGLSFLSLVYLYQSMSSSPHMISLMKPPLRWPEFQISRLNRSRVIILLWMWLPGPVNTIGACSELLGLPADCHFTTNHDTYPMADGVLMHHRNVCNGPELLPLGPRPPFQHWIWFNMAPPSQTPNLTLLDDLFNLTMSYRRDSDIVTPFGRLTALDRPYKFTVPRKSRMVAWVWRDWHPGSKQARYYEQLKNYLPVEVFGAEGMVIPQRTLVPILSLYKFYLAFEDDTTEDYITEELWRNALRARAVPVVLGPPRENYERYLPREAFIHVEDFPTAQELAAFLHELDRNHTRYESYFWWQRWWKATVETSWAMRLCRACHVIQEKSGSFQRVLKLSQWFK